MSLHHSSRPEKLSFNRVKGNVRNVFIFCRVLSVFRPIFIENCSYYINSLVSKNTRCHNVDKGCRPVLSRLYSVSYFAVRVRASALDAGISCLTANHTLFYVLPSHPAPYCVRVVNDTQTRMSVSNLLVYSNHVFLMISECRCVPCRKIVVAPQKREQKSSTVAHCCELLVIIRWGTCICKPEGVTTI